MKSKIVLIGTDFDDFTFHLLLSSCFDWEDIFFIVYFDTILQQITKVVQKKRGAATDNILNEK